MIGLALTISLCLGGSATTTALKLTQSLEYEKSEQILSHIRVGKSEAPPAYLYLRLINNFKLLHKKECLRYAEDILDLFDCPERYKVMAYIIRDDASQWKTGDMGDISREMAQVTERIQTKKAGAATQKIQKDIVDKLDKLIKGAEDDQAAAAAAQGKAGGQAEGSSSDPQNESNGGHESGKGAVDPKKFAELSRTWGNLPDKERQRAIQDLTKGLPAKYQEMIERYFRSQAKKDLPSSD